MDNPIRVEDLESTIQLLREYVTDDEINPVIASLEALLKSPEDEALMKDLKTNFHALGLLQGVALTYAPYLIVLMSDDPFGSI